MHGVQGWTLARYGSCRSIVIAFALVLVSVMFACIFRGRLVPVTRHVAPFGVRGASVSRGRPCFPRAESGGRDCLCELTPSLVRAMRAQTPLFHASAHLRLCPGGRWPVPDRSERASAVAF